MLKKCYLEKVLFSYPVNTVDFEKVILCKKCYFVIPPILLTLKMCYFEQVLLCDPANIVDFEKVILCQSVTL